MPDLALSPVAVALYSTLNVASVTSLATGGVYDDVPQPATFPFVLVDVQEREQRGFGMGGLPEVRANVHVYSTYESWSEAQSIAKACIALLKDASLTVSGYAHCGLVFYDDTMLIPNEQINGVKCKELIAQFRIYVEES